ncbi:MAG: hemerythrin domain-containing protein [Magnetococcales bacterium]|nr:hemerythrin domain-containing protein [Magnetococcales bacterium]
MKYQFLPERVVLGHAEIDFQHEMLFFVITGLHRLVKKGRDEGDCVIDPVHIENAFKLLDDYMATHFSYEEELMRSSGFPEASGHAGLHRKFENSMETFRERFMGVDDNQERAILTKRMLDFFFEWVNTHFAVSDRRFCQFLAAQKGEEPPV